MNNNALIFIFATLGIILVSFVLDKKKTMMGFKKGFKMFRKIAVPFLNIFIIVSFSLFIIPPNIIVNFLGKDSVSFIYSQRLFYGMVFER